MNLRDVRLRLLRQLCFSRVTSTLLLTVPAILVLQGCGGEEWHADTYPAHGRITINGEAPEGAVIELHSSGGEQPDVRNSRPWGIVQADGTFTLSTYETGDGAPLGHYAVLIRWPPDVSQPSFADRLGGAYSTTQKSKWSVTIEAGENELAPIDITGAKVVSKENARPPRKAPPGPGMSQ